MIRTTPVGRQTPGSLVCDLVLAAQLCPGTVGSYGPTVDTVNCLLEIVVGTCRPSHGSFRSTIRTGGVLKLTSRSSSYDWEFVPLAGGTFVQSGSTACH